MDIVYICRDGDNEELRYSIRSVVANLPHDNIWVVGGKPSWYSGNHISVPQTRTKYENARNNMRAIVESEEISNNFILMNDDFFVVKETKRLGTYHAGNINKRLEELKMRYGRSSYLTLLMNTIKFVRSHGRRTVLDYALHIPFKMNKEKLRPILEHNVSWRVAYGNINKIGGREVKLYHGETRDVKLYLVRGQVKTVGKNTISDRFWSSHDESFPMMLPLLQELFPNPTEYEEQRKPRSKKGGGADSARVPQKLS
jgi:hypothetical protein